MAIQTAGLRPCLPPAMTLFKKKQKQKQHQQQKKNVHALDLFSAELVDLYMQCKILICCQCVVNEVFSLPIQDHKQLSCHVMSDSSVPRPFFVFISEDFCPNRAWCGAVRQVSLSSSHSEAEGWQRLSWWWQLNDLFFIKHLLLSLSLPDYLASSSPSVSLFIFWLTALPLLLYFSFLRVCLPPPFTFFSPFRLTTSHIVSMLVSLSFLVFYLVVFSSKRKWGYTTILHFALRSSASELVSLSIC